jgi:hypothetical protein
MSKRRPSMTPADRRIFEVDLQLISTIGDLEVGVKCAPAHIKILPPSLSPVVMRKSFDLTGKRRCSLFPGCGAVPLR